MSEFQVHPFKEGDEVVLIDNKDGYEHLPLGKVGTVLGVYRSSWPSRGRPKGSPMIRVSFGSASHWQGMFAGRFELPKAPVVDTTPWWESSIGEKDG